MGAGIVYGIKLIIMEKIGIFYGSTTGNTAAVAKKIADCLGVAESDVHDVAKTAPSKVADYDVLVLGSSIWGDGDMQDDMHDFIDGVSAIDLKGKKMALFGCGDETMTETFCNAVGEMHDALKDTGVRFIGNYNTDGYEFNHSDSVKDNVAEGLLIDNVNHEEMTDNRIAAWCAEIKMEI